MNVRSSFLALAAFTAASLITGIAVSPAMAASPAMAEVHGITVHYDDLNLASPAGRARLDRRLVQAASALCGRYDSRELRLSTMSHACRRQAVRNARGQLATALRGGDYASADMSVSQAAF